MDNLFSRGGGSFLLFIVFFYLENIYKIIIPYPQRKSNILGQSFSKGLENFYIIWYNNIKEVRVYERHEIYGKRKTEGS